MVDRDVILNFLKRNDISPSAPDNEIQAALDRAGWHHDDVIDALSVLKTGVAADHAATASRSREVFYTNVPIAPESLSSLLGISVSLPRAQMRAIEHRQMMSARYSMISFFLMITLSLAIGFGAILGIMYLYNIGPFYTPVENYVF